MTIASVHVLRYGQERTWDELREPPAGATYWHPGVTAPRAVTGLPVHDLRSWTALACWPDAEHWRTALDETGPWSLAAEAWSALLVPGPTRDLPSAPQWAGGRSEPPFGAPQPGGRGPAAVLTTAGLSADDPGAALHFLADVERVVETLADAPGSEGFRLGAAERFPAEVDPFTFSLWSDLRAARAWAYGTPVHTSAIAAHTDRPHVQRGSFTTFSVVETRGTWSDRHALRRPAPAG